MAVILTLCTGYCIQSAANLRRCLPDCQEESGPDNLAALPDGVLARPEPPNGRRNAAVAATGRLAFRRAAARGRPDTAAALFRRDLLQQALPVTM
jgi:hypothetical protein